MLNTFVAAMLRFRGMVLALACVLGGYGFYVAVHSPMDVFPDFVPPQATIQTESPGLSPEQVEGLVTRPVEAALGGLSSIESMRSESIQGLSIITIVFAEGTELLPARQMLAERLAELGGVLPAGVSTPRISPLTSSTMDLLKIGLRSTNRSQVDLRSFVDWTLRPRLLAVPGVARCSVFGGEVRQFQVVIRPERLVALGVSLQEVANAVRKSSGIRGAGFIETRNQRILLNVDGQAWTPAELAESVVRVGANGFPIRVRDIGEVREGFEPKFGDALVLGEPGVLVTLASQYGANTMDATRAVERALTELTPLFQREGIEVFPALHRPATFIERALKNIQHSLVLGGLLVSIVLLFFLGDLRASLISLVAIPLSLLAAVLMMKRMGIGLNTLTLGGLAIAIGEVVDDAIIDVENILRRLRQNAASANPKPPIEVIVSASVEVRGAVVYATLVVALVFVPVLSMSGLQGAFFSPLAKSYLLAVLASLGIAMTLTPVLAFLAFRRVGKADSEPRLQRATRSVYGRLLKPLMRYPLILGAFSGWLFLSALVCLTRFSLEFLPTFKEGHYVLQVSMAPGTSIEEMARVGRRLSRRLLAVPGVATVEQQIGRAEQGEDPWGSHRSEFHVELIPATAQLQDKAADGIRSVLQATPGIQYEMLTFLGDRIGESIGGETQPVVVSLFGEDLSELDKLSASLVSILESIPGAAEIQMKSPPGSPTLSVQLNSERMLALGLQRVDVLECIQAAFQGATLAQIYKGNSVVGVGLTLSDEWKGDPELVGEVPLTNGAGQMIPLKAVADISMGAGRHSVLHDGARRRQVVTCNVQDRAIGEFVGELEKRMGEQLDFPRGVYAVVGGTSEASRRAISELLVNSMVCGIGIVGLLGWVLGTRQNLTLVLANVPFALVGGVLAVLIDAWVHEGRPNLSLGGIVGFVTLFGISMRNSIMLISHYDHLVLNEGMNWGLETAIQGASERLGPILMTAMVTGLGLLPLAMGAGEAGREIEGPMAVVILGGLFTSTCLNLLVLPSLALRFARFKSEVGNRSHSS